MKTEQVKIKATGCPGSGRGIATSLIADALESLKIQYAISAEYEISVESTALKEWNLNVQHEANKIT